MALNTITQIVLPDGTEIALADWTDRPLYSACDLGSGYTDQEMDLFQYTAGLPVPGAAPSPGFRLRSSTLTDTDTANAGEMATTEELLVYAIKPEVQTFLWDTEDFGSRRYLGGPTTLGTTVVGLPGTPIEVLAVLAQMLLIRLRISDKDYAQSGFAYFNPGFGPYGISSVGANGAGVGSVAMGSLGLPSQEAVRSFAIPNHIGAQEKYRVTLVNDTGASVDFAKALSAPDSGIYVNDPEVMVTIRINLDGLYKRPTA